MRRDARAALTIAKTRPKIGLSAGRSSTASFDDWMVGAPGLQSARFFKWLRWANRFWCALDARRRLKMVEIGKSHFDHFAHAAGHIVAGIALQGLQGPMGMIGSST